MVLSEKVKLESVVAEWLRALNSSSAVSDQQSVGSSPSHDTFVLKARHQNFCWSFGRDLILVLFSSLSMHIRRPQDTMRKHPVFVFFNATEFCNDFRSKTTIVMYSSLLFFIKDITEDGADVPRVHTAE